MRYVSQFIFVVIVLAATLVTGCGGGSAFYTPSPVQQNAATKRVSNLVVSASPTVSTSGSAGELRYAISGMPQIGAGGLYWADVTFTEPEQAQTIRTLSMNGNAPRAIAQKVTPTTFTAHVPIINGKPYLPKSVAQEAIGHAAQPFDHALSGCGTTPYVTVTPGAQVSTDWYFPEVLVGQNGQPYNGNITWAQGSTFTVPITGSVAFNPAQTPNDAKTITDETFSIPENITPNLYEYSATGVLGDGTQEGTGVLTLLAYYPVIDPVNTSTTYVLVKPGGSASYTFSDQTDARDGAATWVVWSAIPPSSSSAWLNATTSSPPHANTLTIKTSSTTPTGVYAIGILIQYPSPLCRQSEGNAANVLIDVETPSPTPSPSPTASASSAASSAPTSSASPSPGPTSSGCGGGGFARIRRLNATRPYATCSAIPVVPYIEISALVTQIRSVPTPSFSPSAIETAPSVIRFNLGPYSPQVTFTGPVHLKLDQPSPTPSSPWTLKLDRSHRSAETSQATRQISILLKSQLASYIVPFACLNLPFGTYTSAEGYWEVNGQKYSQIVPLSQLPLPASPLVVPSTKLLTALEGKVGNPTWVSQRLPYVLNAFNTNGIRDLNWIADILSQIEIESGGWGAFNKGEVEKTDQTFADNNYENQCGNHPSTPTSKHDDAFFFNGHGLVQLTGRCIYHWYSYHAPLINPTGINIEANPSALTASPAPAANAQLDANIAVDIFLTGRNRGCRELGPPYNDSSDVTCGQPDDGTNLGTYMGQLQPDGGTDEQLPTKADVDSSRNVEGGYPNITRMESDFAAYRSVDDGC